MLVTELIIDSPEKFAPSEVKTALISKFPNHTVWNTADLTPGLIIECTQDIWNWLQDYYLFPNQLSTFPDHSQTKSFIVIPFAG